MVEPLRQITAPHLNIIDVSDANDEKNYHTDRFENQNNSPILDGLQSSTTPPALAKAKTAANGEQTEETKVIPDLSFNQNRIQS